jgi:hypothetical protein
MPLVLSLGAGWPPNVRFPSAHTDGRPAPEGHDANPAPRHEQRGARAAAAGTPDAISRSVCGACGAASGDHTWRKRDGGTEASRRIAATRAQSHAHELGATSLNECSGAPPSSKAASRPLDPRPTLRGSDARQPRRSLRKTAALRVSHGRCDVSCFRCRPLIVFPSRDALRPLPGTADRVVPVRTG